MYISTFWMQDLLRTPGGDSGPCSSLLVQYSSIKALPYRSRHIANTFKEPESKSPTPSTCRTGAGQSQTVPYLGPFSLHIPCPFTVDSYVDWVVNQVFGNLSSILAPVPDTDIKLLSSPDPPPQHKFQKGEPPSFSELFWAVVLLKLVIRCLGNVSYPSSSGPAGPKHTLSFGNDQDGSNKKQRQDRNNSNGHNNNPGDNGGNEHGNNNNNGKAPEDKDVVNAEGKENELLYACAFYKVDPVKYRKCGHLEIKSIAYFLQHIIRQHLLDDKYYHCDNCRVGWARDGRNSDTLWAEHNRAGTCQRVTLEEKGKLLPEEHRRMKRRLKEKPTGTEFERWYKVWELLFPDHERPDSPYLGNIAEEIEASNLRRLEGVLEEDLSQVPSGPERDRMEAFARSVIERAFPAHPREAFANTGPSSSRGPALAPTPRPTALVVGTRMPAGNLAPPPRLAPNGSDRHPRSTGLPTNPGLMVNQGRMSTRLPANHRMMNSALLEYPAFAMHPGLTNPRLPVDPTLMDRRVLGNPALTMNSGMMSTANPRYPMIPEQTNLGQMRYGPPANLGNSMDTIDPSLLTNSGPANPTSPTNSPLNLNTIHHHSINSFRANNNTAGFDHAAFASGVGRGIEAFYFSSQSPEQSPDMDNCPETSQNPWRRI